MIRFKIDTSTTPNTLMISATFHGHDPLVIQKQGTPEELRDLLRTEYMAHLHSLVIDITRLTDTDATWALALKQKAKLFSISVGRTGDHVSFARDLQDIMGEMNFLLNLSHDKVMLGRVIKDLAETVEYMVESTESLKIRGPIELLGGTIVRTWDKTEKAT